VKEAGCQALFGRIGQKLWRAFGEMRPHLEGVRRDWGWFLFVKKPDEITVKVVVVKDIFDISSKVFRFPGPRVLTGGNKEAAHLGGQGGDRGEEAPQG